MKTKIKILSIVLIFLVISCQQKKLDRINFLEIITHPAENVTLTSATLSGEVKGIQVGAVEQYGFVWSTTNENPTFVINDGQVLFGAKESDGPFSTELTELDKKQTYFVRSFVIANQEEKYGETISFLTNDIQISTDSLQYSKGRTATIYGTFTGVNSSLEINRLGIVWSKTNEEPSISGAMPDEFVELGAPLSDGLFSGSMNNIEDSTKYYYRTFAVLNFGNEITYGATKTWETNLVDVWKQKKSMPEPLRYGRGLSVGSFGYMIAGNNMFRYDPNLDEWEIMAETGMPAVWESAVFAIGTNIYVVCGQSSVENFSKTFYKYDTLTDEWDTTLPEFPGPGRKWTIGFGIGDAGYVGVGTGEGGVSIRDFWKYDEVNGWDSLAVTNPEFPGTIHRILMGGFSDNERGYIAGDQNSGNFWVYTPETNTWEEKGPLPGGKSSSMASFHIDNNLYLCTGITQGLGFSRALWRYNHEDDTWDPLANLPGLPRHQGMGFAIGNKGYVGGGFVPQDQGEVETDGFWEYKAPPE